MRPASSAIGTTRRGIGPAYEDKVGRRAIRVGDLGEPDMLPLKVNTLLAHHNALRKGLGQPQIDAAKLTAELLELAPKILPFAEDVWERLDGLRAAGKRILFEGAQATMLDIDHGTYPYVTSSNTVAAQAMIGSGHGQRRGRLRAGHRQGLHHARRRRPLPDRADRRDRPGPGRSRQGVRHQHRPAAAAAAGSTR